jgi:hypothetical protein
MYIQPLIRMLESNSRVINHTKKAKSFFFSLKNIENFIDSTITLLETSKIRHFRRALILKCLKFINNIWFSILQSELFK